ncbi:DUF5320 domain-containing protein [Candidatus Sumerlaeota bacterium]|nr:DUF5320 domain-containing protein [Candidatus Sumerlaeota bacterium]
MPAGDRTGPLGQGPRTGRAAGLCVGNPQPGYVSSGFGRGGWGRGRGRGGGRGWRHRRWAVDWPGGGQAAFQGAAESDSLALSRETGIEDLRAEVRSLRDVLKGIQGRLDELSDAPGGEG